MDASRREFLATLAVAAAIPACAPEVARDDEHGLDAPIVPAGDAFAAPAITPEAPPSDDAIDRDPFTLGVASGDSTSSGVVIWTRLCFDPRAGGLPDRAIDVRWEVAADDAFEHVIASQIIAARPEHAHSLHVEVEGLPADVEVFYRFAVSGFVSATGRARTAPGDDVMPERLRFVIASCQRYDDGFYTAHAAIAEESIDFVIFLGDYVYETSNPHGVRPLPDPTPIDLAGYRARYAIARSDASLQAAHARAPWFVTFDDHEVENNYAGTIPEHAQDGFEARRAAAYQAFWEHTPMRGGPPIEGALRVHRALRWGALVDGFVLDTRQHRTDQLCGDVIGPPCAELADEHGSLLGETQEDWLLEGLRAARAPWVLVAQQLPMVDTFFGGDPAHPDAWEGYPSQRRRLTEAFGETSGVLVLSGDRHAAYCTVVHRDPRDPESDAVAVELQCTSISTGGDGAPGQDDEGRALVASNPVFRYATGRWRGYTRVTLTPALGRADFRVMSTVREPVAAVLDDARFLLDPLVALPRRV
ncbi:alkaline phosphatase D family protein [Sandaracinus amylolyticus]|uniref:alkaline phosphatase D family protein n=1 Tax=Sandaracinus amylolyticus TaxID=927083 RepID=UPI001F32EF8D|nr:alkaline phosphatase D family protein [Sandaracinus amylolyticus]UJR85727.1 Hypothetical protein I5071_78070 [Sandaracinus amylolyticus]